MTVFLLIATAMLALALLFVLPSLLCQEHAQDTYQNAQIQRGALNLAVLRDQLRELEVDFQGDSIDASGYQSTRQELVRRVAEDVTASVPPPPHAIPRQRGLAVTLALAIPLVAGALYAMLGTPTAFMRAQVSADTPVDPASVSAEQIEGMVARLAAKLKSNPDDASGWRKLARSYETLQRFDQAVLAYQQLLRLSPDNADLLTDYAVTLAMSRNQSLSGEPEKLIHRALEIDPDHIQALTLSGSAAFERQEYAKAVKPWKKILDRLPDDSEMARSIAANIAKAEALARAR